jgi:hypothetical protein
MSGVFRTIDPPPPHRPASECVPLTPAFGAGGGHTRGERGRGVNSSEDARHCSVLYICKYFVVTDKNITDVSNRMATARDTAAS